MKKLPNTQSTATWDRHFTACESYCTACTVHCRLKQKTKKQNKKPLTFTSITLTGKQAVVCRLPCQQAMQWRRLLTADTSINNIAHCNQPVMKEAKQNTTKVKPQAQYLQMNTQQMSASPFHWCMSGRRPTQTFRLILPIFSSVVHIARTVANNPSDPCSDSQSNLFKPIQFHCSLGTCRSKWHFYSRVLSVLMLNVMSLVQTTLVIGYG